MTTAFIPGDEDARLRIRESLDETLFVEAGAGTGKTTSLVDRVYGLVLSGRTTLDNIAAITFTEAAAAELRDKIRERFEQGAGNTLLRHEERARAEQGVADLDQAWILTLHSFSMRLLQERPLEAGLPPSFEARDQITSDLAFDRVWNVWWDAALEDPDLEHSLTVALSLGLGHDHLKTVARQFHSNHDLLEDANFIDWPISSDSVARDIGDYSQNLRGLCNFSHLRDEDVLYSHVQGLLGLIDRIQGTQRDDVSAYRLLGRLFPIRFTRGRQSDWDSDPESGLNACAVIKDLLRDLETSVTDELNQVRQAALMPLLMSLREVILEYARDRKLDGQVEFHDLLVWARDLLRNDIEVRDYFRNQFSHLLIDEAQDTDPIQTEIAMFLAERDPLETPIEKRPRRWTEVVPDPGKLFIVGDPKQSIYRFRRADIKQMLSLRAHIAGDPVRLQQNFRSHKVVLTWVNKVFAQWMTGSESQSEYTSVSHRWELEVEHPAAPSVWSLGGEQDDTRIGPVRQNEARAIASLLMDIVSHEWQVMDVSKTDEDGKERYRPASYSDICILMPTRTSLHLLEIALDNVGVPYRLEGASLVFATQEIKDLINCLRSIDDPSDQVALVAALRSPAFGCSDVDLLEFVEAGGRFDYLSEKSAMTGPVSDAMEILRKCHSERLWTSVPLLVDRFVRERSLMESALGSSQTRQQWRRYRFLVEQARAFGEVGGNSLRGFLDWVERQAEEGARVTEAPVPESDEEAVRVMTVHSAKGLEFPVVILTGLNSSRRGGAADVIFDRDSGNVEVGVGRQGERFETQGYGLAAKNEATIDEEEHVRLLYVATTRARDHLVLNMYRTARDSKSTAAVLAGLLEGQDGLWKNIVPSSALGADSSGASIDAMKLEGHSIADLEAWKARRAELFVDRGRPVSVAATTLARIEKEESLAEEPWKRGRGGTSIGRAVHAVLQTVDLETGSGIDEVSQAQAAAEGIAQRQTEIARLVRSAVDSDVVKRAVESDNLWREVPVGVPIADGVLEGFIDLLFEEEDGLVVVDYKTDSLDSEETTDAIQRYRLQGGAYALAIQRATGKRVKEIVFLFLRPRREEVLSDIPGLMKDAEQAALNYLRTGSN